MRESAYRWWVAGLMYLSAILCTLGLGRPSLWIDEAHSYEFASLPSLMLVLLNAAARDAYPPLYFLLLHAWQYLGNDEIWLRMFSVLLHLGSIPLVYLLGARLVSRPAGLIAAALLAVSPFHLAFAREVRMYSLVAFLAILSQLGLVMWIKGASRKGYWVFLLAGLALIYTHFMGALLIAAQALILAFDGLGTRRRRREGLRWVVILAVAFLPWSPLFLKAVVVTHGYGGEAPFHHLAFYFLSAVGAGFGQAPWVLGFGAVTVVALAAAGWLAVPAGLPRRFLLLWAIVPLALELGVTAAGKPVFGERTLITSVPAWILLMASAAAPAASGGVIRRAVRLVPAGLLAGLSFAHALGFGVLRSPDHREALGYVVKHASPGDVILHGSVVTYHPVHQYYLPLARERSARARIRDFLVEPQGGFSGGAVGSWFRSRWRAMRRFLDPGGSIATGRDPARIGEAELVRHDPERIWFFRTDPEGARRVWHLIPSVYYDPAPEKIRVVKFTDHGKLSGRYAIVDRKRFPGLKLELYRRR